MQNKFLISILYFCFLSVSYSWSQTSKGLWTTGGSFKFEQTQSLGIQFSEVVIQTELGYSFHSRWMIWGKLSIDLQEKLSIVGHRLNLRYAFFKLKPIETYVGLDYENVERRFLKPGGGSNSRVGVLIGPFAGYLHFLNNNTALEFEIRYPFYQNHKFNGNNNRLNGTIQTKLGLRFYFDSKLPVNIEAKEIQLLARQWMIGGTVSLGKDNILGFSRSVAVNPIIPYAGYMLSKKWMIGVRLHYQNQQDLDQFDFGLNPFGRYYFRQKAKNVFYAETGIIYKFAHFIYPNNTKETKLTQRAGTLGLGWHRWIVPHVCLDLQLGGHWSEVLEFSGDDLVFSQLLYLKVGMEVYL